MNRVDDSVVRLEPLVWDGVGNEFRMAMGSRVSRGEPATSDLAMAMGEAA